LLLLLFTSAGLVPFIAEAIAGRKSGSKGAAPLHNWHTKKLVIFSDCFKASDRIFCVQHNQQACPYYARMVKQFNGIIRIQISDYPDFFAAISFRRVNR